MLFGNICNDACFFKYLSAQVMGPPPTLRQKVSCQRGHGYVIKMAASLCQCYQVRVPTADSYV